MAERVVIQMAATACVLAVVLSLAGCTERIVYRNVNVAVPVYPEVPDWMFQDYQGELPEAGAGMCFDEQNTKRLQDFILWQHDMINEFRSVVRTGESK